MNLPPFDRAIDEHGALVLRVLTRIVGGHDAEDCWQETFLAALRAYPDLTPGSNVRGWLLTIAHRKAIDRLRARARSPVTDAVGATTVEPPDAVDDALWTAVRALPPKQRHAITYRYVADLPYRSIAALLGGSEAAARQNVRDGLRSLRQEVSR